MRFVDRREAKRAEAKELSLQGALGEYDAGPGWVLGSSLISVRKVLYEPKTPLARCEHRFLLNLTLLPVQKIITAA
jgi:hypothetical protein